MPSTSIIVATHSRPHLLPRAVASAQAAGADVEVIVVDDGSTDNTASVCRALKGIKYLRLDRNRGVAGARNAGILASTGDYVSFLDDDDVRLAQSLDNQVQALELNPEAGLVYGQAILGDLNCKPTAGIYPARCPRGNLFWELLKQNFIPCGSAVFRRSCILRVGLLKEELAGIDDWDLWIRIAEHYRVTAVDQPVMIWRRSTLDSNQGTSNAIQLVTLASHQFRNWMKLPTAAHASAKEKRAARLGFSENMAWHLIWDAARALRSGRPVRAASDVLGALRFHPRGLVRLVHNRATFLFLRTRVQRLGTASPGFN